MMNFLKKLLLFFVFVALFFAVTITLINGIIALTDSFILTEDWLFYEYSPICGDFLIFSVMVPTFLSVGYLCLRLGVRFLRVRLGKDETKDMMWFFSMLNKYKFIIIPVWILVLYISFTSITVVTPDKIIRHTPISPSGREYAYTDVERIETGFGRKSFALYDYKKDGNFYYIITVNGKEIVFSQPTANNDVERYDDPYLELEEFDIALTAKGIKKESSREGFEDCDYDKRDVDRFLRIIDRK